MTESVIPNNIKIRPIKRADAEKVGQMIKGMAEYLRSLGDDTDFQFNAKSFLRDGFGRNRAFYGLIAEVNGKAAGYSLYHDGYDTDKGFRIVYLADLRASGIPGHRIGTAVNRGGKNSRQEAGCEKDILDGLCAQSCCPTILLAHRRALFH